MANPRVIQTHIICPTCRGRMRSRLGRAGVFYFCPGQYAGNGPYARNGPACSQKTISSSRLPAEAILEIYHDEDTAAIDVVLDADAIF